MSGSGMLDIEKVGFGRVILEPITGVQGMTSRALIFWGFKTNLFIFYFVLLQGSRKHGVREVS